MTEYDYSPAAYERYLEKLARVEHWVTDQRYCAPRYSNPFASANAGQSSAHVPRGSSRPRDVVPSRTRAMSPTGQGTQPRQSSSSRSRSQPRAAPIRSQTMPNTQHRAVVYPSNHTPPHVVHHPQHAAVPPIPAGANAVYRTYEYDPRSGKDIVLPPPRPGETYVIIPPGGRKLEVVVSLSFPLLSFTALLLRHECGCE